MRSRRVPWSITRTERSLKRSDSSVMEVAREVISDVREVGWRS